MKKRKFCLT